MTGRQAVRIKFSKMQGLGNDFVVIDGVRQAIDLNAEQLRHLGDRHFGVGCDQILLVEQSDRADVDFRYRIFNADGGEVEQCGNGARCFVRFVHERGLTGKREIRVETMKGVITLRLENDENVTVDMGVPEFTPAKIPFVSDSSALVQTLDVDGAEVAITAVSMGNPHAVVEAADLAHAPVERLGKGLQAHGAFPESVNVGFVEVVAPDHLRLRVYERGAGETLACGSGACAAVAVLTRQGRLPAGAPVAVDLPGGRLRIQYDPASGHVRMGGPTAFVFDGTMSGEDQP